MKPSAFAALATALFALDARAQSDAAVDAAPGPVDASPVDAAPAPSGAFARVASEPQHAALEKELAGLTGLARAERLWRFVRTFPDDPSASRLEGEARSLLQAARAAASATSLVREIDAVLRAETPAARAAAIAGLEALGEARAIPFLEYVARRDRELDTRATAARAIGRFSSPEAVDVALRIVGDAAEAVPVRVAALEGVAPSRQERVGAELIKVAQEGDQPGELRRAAFAAIQAHHPALAERAGPAPIATSSGRALSIVVGAASGGYALGLVGALSPGGGSGVATGVGAFGGLVIGGTAAALLSASYPITQGDAVYLASAAVWSIPLGVLLGSLSGGPSGDCDSPACPGIMLATHAAAMGTAWLTREPLRLSVRDGLELNLITAAATSLVRGTLLQFTPTGDDRPAYGALAFGMTAGLVGGTLAAPRLHLDNEDLLLAAAAVGDLALTGFLLGDGLVPDYVEGPLGSTTWNSDKSGQVSGLAFIGAGLGVGAAIAANTFWKPTYSDVGLLTAASIDGLLLGGGLGMAINDDDDRAAQVGAAVASLAVVGTTAALLRPLSLKLDRGDPILLAMGQGFAAWQAFGWGSYYAMSSGASGDAAFKAGLVGTGLAGLGLIAATQFVDQPAWSLGWAFSGGVWGGWLAGWSAYAADWSGEASLLATLVGSGLGLAASSVLVSPLVGVSPSTLAWTTVGGVAGMTLGTMGGVFLTGGSSAGVEHPVAIGNVVGSVIGLAAGVGIAHVIGPKAGAAGDGRDDAGGPSLLDGVPAPTPSVAPMTDANGRLVQGMQASLVWRL